MFACLNILYNVIKSRVPVMSLQCRRLLDSSILPSIAGFEGAMDCSLREALRKEQSIAPGKEILDPSGPRKGGNSLHKIFFGVSKTGRVFASQRMVLLMFFEALYFGHLLLFYTMQLEPPKSDDTFGIVNFVMLPHLH